MAGKIRARKDGGCSVCNAADSNVGKRRCCHLLDNADIKIRYEQGTNYIDLSGNMDNSSISFSMKASETKIKDFITALSDGLTKEEKEEILSIVRGV